MLSLKSIESLLVKSSLSREAVHVILPRASVQVIEELLVCSTRVETLHLICFCKKRCCNFVYSLKTQNQMLFGA